MAGRTLNDARAGWGADGLPDGPPKKTFYDPFGRPRVLPADSGHSLQHYLDQGLTLEPPENPIPIERLGDFARRDGTREGPMSATRQVAPSEAPAIHSPAGVTTAELMNASQTIHRLEQLLAEAETKLKVVEPKKGRGPDRKKRRKRKRNRA